MDARRQAAEGGARQEPRVGGERRENLPCSVLGALLLFLLLKACFAFLVFVLKACFTPAWITALTY